jgi:hypothetical protein
MPRQRERKRLALGSEARSPVRGAPPADVSVPWQVSFDMKAGQVCTK